MWESRVLQRAFERLELHEGKLSRAVLRGGGGGDVTSLPDPGWATTQVYPARITHEPTPDYPRKNELTSRQEARERRIVGSLKPFRWNPAGNQSRPVELDQQPEASLAWRVGDHPCEA